MSANEIVIHLDQKIVWEGGKPVAKYTKIIDKEAVADLPLAVIGLPYKREPLEVELGIDVEFEGMSNAEVMMLKMARSAANGNRADRRDLLDRILGKPKTSAEVKTVKVDYNDYLKDLAKVVDAEEAEFTTENL